MRMARVTDAHGGERRIRALDGLRAVSIILVLIAHATFGLQTSASATVRQLAGWLRLGQLGVTVFFVISGYLITTLLVREMEQAGQVSLRHFYLRRTLRIFPAYYAYLLCLAVATSLGRLTLAPSDFMHAASYTVNFQTRMPWMTGHAWTLSVEEQFYLMWPAIFALMGRRRAVIVAWAAIGLCPLVRLAHILRVPGDNLTQYPFQYVADALAVGCLFAMQRPLLHSRRWYLAALTSRWAALAPLAAALIAELPFRPRVCPPWAFGLVAVTLGYVAIVFTIDRILTLSHTGTRNALEHPLLVWIGGMSYSIYLWQQPFLDHDGTAPWQSFPANLMLALGAAYLSARMIEQPALRLRHRIERHRWFSTAMRGQPHGAAAWPASTARDTVAAG